MGILGASAHGHFVKRCKCGNVIDQCRCWASDKNVEIVESCDKCQPPSNELPDGDKDYPFKKRPPYSQNDGA